MLSVVAGWFHCGKRHLPAGTEWLEVAAPGEPVPEGVLAVLRHDFPAPAVPGRPDPANAQAVIEVIARAVEWLEQHLSPYRRPTSARSVA